MKFNAQSASLWIAAGSAMLGTACVFAFLSFPGRHPYLLDGMEVTAATSISAVLLNLLLVLMDRGPQLPSEDEEATVRASEQTEDSLRHHSTARRRELIEKRLQIDEPRLCSHSKLFCSCWSFCGGSSGLGVIPAANDPRARKSDAVPTVDRSNVTDCPYT